jgi:hypothetical protein
MADLIDTFFGHISESFSIVNRFVVSYSSVEYNNSMGLLLIIHWGTEGPFGLATLFVHAQNIPGTLLRRMI